MGKKIFSAQEVAEARERARKLHESTIANSRAEEQEAVEEDDPGRYGPNGVDFGPIGGRSFLFKS